MPLQAVNAQLNPITSGYTNQYMLRTRNVGDLTVKYIIRGGVLGILPIIF